MALTILGGQAAAFKINLPAQVRFRPTSVMLRRKLFDAHQTWKGEGFFDVCAGSGAMGMEAWSRGAESFFGEKDGQVLKLLTTNLQRFMARLT
ncbi:MAG: RsmD family RNA methyltransferase, partial [Bacteriovoracaceae bacterium]|nr:RsmD family RNA methyltransferase [Bacteriovoracaceae bacterium]